MVNMLWEDDTNYEIDWAGEWIEDGRTKRSEQESGGGKEGREMRGKKENCKRYMEREEIGKTEGDKRSRSREESGGEEKGEEMWSERERGIEKLFDCFEVINIEYGVEQFK